MRIGDMVIPIGAVVLVDGWREYYEATVLKIATVSDRDRELGRGLVLIRRNQRTRHNWSLKPEWVSASNIEAVLQRPPVCLCVTRDCENSPNRYIDRTKCPIHAPAEEDARERELTNNLKNANEFALHIVSALGYRTDDLENDEQPFPSKQIILEVIGQIEEGKVKNADQLAAKDAEIARLQEEVAELKAECDESDDTYGILLDKLKNKNAQNETLQARVKELEAQRRNLCMCGHSAEDHPKGSKPIDPLFCMIDTCMCDEFISRDTQPDRPPDDTIRAAEAAALRAAVKLLGHEHRVGWPDPCPLCGPKERIEALITPDRQTALDRVIAQAVLDESKWWADHDIEDYDTQSQWDAIAVERIAELEAQVNK